VASGFPPTNEKRRICPSAPAKSQNSLLKILTKYILKEHVGPLVFSLSALTSLLLLNYVAKQFGQLVGKGLPWDVIAQFMLLSVPFTVELTLPMAVLVATLHAFSRLASENEITAFKASGMALQRLMLPVIAATGLLTLGMVWFNDQVTPAANHRLATLSNDIARKKPTFALKERVINEVSPGRLFLSTSRLFGTNQMRDVTIYDLSDPLTRTTIRADSGTLELSPNRQDLLLTLFHGSWTVLKPEDPTRLQRVFFNTDFVKVRNVGNTLELDSIGGQKSDREMTVCELQQRVERLARSRDSVFRLIQSLDANTAKGLDPKTRSGGLGSLYCHRSIPAKVVRAASAAELPRQGPQPPAPQPVQQPVQQPTPQPLPQAAQQAPGVVPPAAQQAPGAVPPARLLTPMPEQGRTLAPADRAVQAAQLKLQLGLAQNTIDGDRVEIEKKFAIACSCVIFALLGAPVALRFPRGGVGLTIGVSLGVFTVYYVGLIAGDALARDNLVSPFWAMWLTNIVLLTIGLVLTARLGREGATSRGSEASELITRLRERFVAWRGGNA
jgi:lipopolysaccharide export system permease protein